MCAAFSQRTGVATLCLRPVAVFDAADYARAMQPPATPRPPAAPPPATPPPSPPGRSWHLGVHVDVRDVADAVAAAVACPVPKHARMLLCAEDIAGDTPTRTLVARYVAGVPWRGGTEYDTDPFRSLVDTGRARAILGWAPRFKWPTRRRA
jgi:nucleoside-diphosphate-sugar epimerase